MRFRNIFFLLLLSVLLSTGIIFSQVNPDSSRLIGKVVDQVSQPLAGVEVSLLHQRSGRSFKTTSTPEGMFYFDFLPSGYYTVAALFEGYQESSIEILLNLGKELPLTVVLVDKEWTDVVTVTSTVPPVPTTTTDSVSHIPMEVIDSLPMNGRDFSDLVALVPEVVSDPDQRIHIGGGRGIFTSYQLDGVDNNSAFFGEERGGTLPTFTLSQSAVAEFQVSRVPFSVQYGGTSGGVVNAVTRSGESQFKGDVFFYYRDESFVADDANGRSSDNFEQNQYGFTVGGPISETWFYFVSADLQDFSRPTYRSWDDPQGALNDPDNLEYLSQFIDLDNETGDTLQTNDQQAMLVRFDGQLTGNHNLNFRIQRSDQEGENLTDNYRTTGFSNNGIEKDDFWSSALHVTSILTPTFANEISLQYADESRPREANLTGVPEVIIGPGYDAVFGQKNYLPNSVDEKVYEIKDNLTLFWKNHTVRGGVHGLWSDLGNQFYRYQAGSYLYNTWDDFFAGNASQFTQSFSDVDGLVEFKSRYFALFIQDTYRLDNLTISAGLRYEAQSFTDPSVTNPLLPEGDKPPSSSDLTPRISFSWDPRGDGKSVLRGGWGRFTGTTPSLLVATTYLFNGSVVSRIHLDEGHPDTPAFPDILASQGSLGANIPDVYFFDSDFEQPRAERLLLEYEYFLGHGWIASVSGHYAAFDRLERKQDTNLTILDENLYSKSPRPDSDFGRKIAFLSDAWGRYKALTLQTRYRGEKLFFHAHYTWSESEDNDSNERSTSTRAFYPEDQYNLLSSWGPGNFDAPHRVVIYGIWSLHPKWKASGQVIYQSGFPYTALSHTDLNGDGYYTDHAVWEGERFGRNTFRQPDFKTADFRLSYSQPLKRGEVVFMLDIFNAFDFSNRTTDQLIYTMTDEAGNLIRDPDFGDPNIAGYPRQFQIGAKYSF